MPQKQDLEIIITQDGQIKVEVKGMKGPGCLSELEKVAQKLGEVNSQQLRPEYYQHPAAGDQPRPKS